MSFQENTALKNKNQQLLDDSKLMTEIKDLRTHNQIVL